MYPGEGKIRFYSNALAKLREEITRKRKKPVAVYFSPSSDPFQPVAEVLDMTYEVFSFLFDSGVGVAFLSKGLIPEKHMKLLAANASQVRAQIGVTTLDGRLAKMFEPLAAAPEVRVRQIKELTRAGVKTQARLDPILPGLTDDADTLNGLCSKLADAGVKELAASALFLRPAVAHSLKRNIRDKDVTQKLLGGFKTGQRLGIHAGRSSVFSLPEAARRAIYARIEKAAKSHGVRVRLCACKNPDIASGSCGIAGEWPGMRQGQKGLFDR